MTENRIVGPGYYPKRPSGSTSRPVYPHVYVGRANVARPPYRIICLQASGYTWDFEYWNDGEARPDGTMAFAIDILFATDILDRSAVLTEIRVEDEEGEVIHRFALPEPVVLQRVIDSGGSQFKFSMSLEWAR